MKWQPIETAPKDGVFIISDGEKASVGWWYGQLLTGWLPADHKPTHWMPLPEPPEAE